MNKYIAYRLSKITYFIILSLLFLQCSNEAATKEKTQSVRPVKYMTIKKTGVSNQHTFSGTSKAKEEARLSFKVAGTINKLFVKVGDPISAGQNIALLDPSDYTVQLKQLEAVESGSKANEKSTEANFIAAKSAYLRIAKLYENNSVSLSQFEQAKAQFTAAKSQYEAAIFNTTASKEQINSAQNQVSYTQLKAPFSGIISSKHIEENEQVNPGTPIVTLSSLKNPEIQVGIPEILISKIKRGMHAHVYFTTIAGKTFEGTVIEVGFSPDNGSTYPVTIDLLTSDEGVRPGMPVDVVFEFSLAQDKVNKILVPAGAIGEDEKGRFVYLLQKNGETATTKKQYIKVGKLRTKGFEVTSGLAEGQLIATAGLNILIEGDVVRLN